MIVLNWTPEHDQKLRTLWNDGLSTKAIGEAMGPTKNAVVGRAGRIDLPPRASPIKRGMTEADRIASTERLRVRRILRLPPIKLTDLAPNPATLGIAPPHVTNPPQSDPLQPAMIAAPAPARAMVCSFVVGPQSEPPRWLYCTDLATHGPYCDAHGTGIWRVAYEWERRAISVGAPD